MSADDDLAARGRAIFDRLRSHEPAEGDSAAEAQGDPVPDPAHDGTVPTASLTGVEVEAVDVADAVPSAEPTPVQPPGEAPGGAVEGAPDVDPDGVSTPTATSITEPAADRAGTPEPRVAAADDPAHEGTVRAAAMTGVVVGEATRDTADEADLQVTAVTTPAPADPAHEGAVGAASVTGLAVDGGRSSAPVADPLLGDPPHEGTVAEASLTGDELVPVPEPAPGRAPAAEAPARAAAGDAEAPTPAVTPAVDPAHEGPLAEASLTGVVVGGGPDETPADVPPAFRSAAGGPEVPEGAPTAVPATPAPDDPTHEGPVPAASTTGVAVAPAVVAAVADAGTSDPAHEGTVAEASMTGVAIAAADAAPEAPAVARPDLPPIDPAHEGAVPGASMTGVAVEPALDAPPGDEGLHDPAHEGTVAGASLTGVTLGVQPRIVDAGAAGTVAAGASVDPAHEGAVAPASATGLTVAEVAPSEPGDLGPGDPSHEGTVLEASLTGVEVSAGSAVTPDTSPSGHLLEPIGEPSDPAHEGTVAEASATGVQVVSPADGAASGGAGAPAAVEAEPSDPAHEGTVAAASLTGVEVDAPASGADDGPTAVAPPDVDPAHEGAVPAASATGVAVDAEPTTAVPVDEERSDPAHEGTVAEASVTTLVVADDAGPAVEVDATPAPAPPASPRPPRPERALPRTIAVANQKGGVGKTTTAVNLGAALAELGYRVLVVDLDPQGNASTGLGINARGLETTIYDVLMRDIPVEDVVEPTSVRGLFVIPATLDLAGAEIELVPAFSRELKLKRALAGSADDYDFTLIDCPPSLGLLTVNALAAASELLVPIQCEYYALEGLSALLRNVQLVQANLNPQLEVSTIVLTMYDARTKLADQVASEVRSHFGNVVCRHVVPRTVRLSEAPSYGQPIITFDPSSRGAIAYREVAKEVAGGPAQRTR